MQKSVNIGLVGEVASRRYKIAVYFTIIKNFVFRNKVCKKITLLAKYFTMYWGFEVGGCSLGWHPFPLNH